MAYDRVLQRHYDGTKFVDPVSRRPECYDEPDEETAQSIVLAGLKGDPADRDCDIFGLQKGKDFDWGKPPKVRQP